MAVCLSVYLSVCLSVRLSLRPSVCLSVCLSVPCSKISSLAKIDEHIQHTLISLTYKVLTTSQPTYLHNLISLQTDNNTRSSDVVTLARPSPASSLKVTGLLLLEFVR